MWIDISISRNHAKTLLLLLLLLLFIIINANFDDIMHHVHNPTSDPQNNIAAAKKLPYLHVLFTAKCFTRLHQPCSQGIFPGFPRTQAREKSL